MNAPKIYTHKHTHGTCAEFRKRHIYIYTRDAHIVGMMCMHINVHDKLIKYLSRRAGGQTYGYVYVRVESM